ncbi:MAG: CehA/McbA family metallohydrolase [Gemmatimonadaceae bacterium]
MRISPDILRRSLTPLVPVVVLSTTMVAPRTSHAQWTNRYPKNVGFGHHVYLEGYELPTLAAGVVDPAVAPDGRTMVFASRGWLWRFDIATGVAERLTQGAGVDSRPTWSPDGRRLAFVRDDSRTTAIMVRDLSSGEEREIDRGMSLDPAFSPDGRVLYFANASAGDLDVWRADFATGAKTRVTTSSTGLELRPQALPDGQRLVYVSKARGGQDEVRLRRLDDGSERALLAGSIVSNLRPAASPDGRLLAYSWPVDDGSWELRLSSLDRPGVSISLVKHPRGRPLTPAWSPDGTWIYYVESDRDQVMQLWRVRANGGAPERVAVRTWNWRAATGRVVIRTRGAGSSEPVPARLSVLDANGHPLIPDRGQPRFDGQNGRVYWYSPGTIELTAPVGPLTVRAVRGLATVEQVTRVSASSDETHEATIDLSPLWNAQANGWYSGDHHFHLNYGGQFDLLPDDLVPLMQGEDLDVGTPMLANLHNRFLDQSLWGYERMGSTPLIAFAQEIRPHFLGHVGAIGTRVLQWPWVWGPGYEVYGRDDRPSATVLDEIRAQGGLGTYVHPTPRDPFDADSSISVIPVGIVPDVVLGHVDLLEVACLWSDEIGASKLWYHFLNLGIPIAPEGGTDAMTDFHRTMAVGATRVYVRPSGTFNYASYLAALKAGRSFVTNGPLLDVHVGGQQPGDVVASGAKVPFRITLASAVPVSKVEIVVNGAVVWTSPGVDSSGTREYAGDVRLPASGWVAVRALGPRTERWPAMDSYAFAHTAPIWIGRRAGVDAASQRQSATELLRILDNAEKRLNAGYAGSDIPKLHAHFAAARAELQRRAAMP